MMTDQVVRLPGELCYSPATASGHSKGQLMVVVVVVDPGQFPASLWPIEGIIQTFRISSEIMTWIG